MKRTNTVADALNSNIAQIDPGDGLPIIPIPLDGKMPGYPGPPGPGVPEGGTTGQYIEKTSDGSSQWVTPTKARFGLGNVDNTSDTDKPISAATQTALDAKASRIELNAKADIVNGKIPVTQIPVEATVTDANVADQIDSPQTGAAIDARINTQVAPQVEQITADYIAGDQAVIDAAAAAVDANPKISALEDKNASQDTQIGTLASRRMLPMFTVGNGADMDTLREPGDYLINTSQTAATLVNAPSARAAYMQVRASGGGSVSQLWVDLYGDENAIYKRSTKAISPTPFPFGPWGKLRMAGDDAPISVAFGADVDSLRTPGVYLVTSGNIAGSLLNAPSANPAMIHVDANPSGLVTQEWRELYKGGDGGTTYRRGTSALSPTPYPFGAWKDLMEVPTSTQLPQGWNAGIANSVLVQDFTRRYGGTISTGGKGAVSIRLDHGLVNYRDKLKSLLDSRGIKHSLALNSRGWSLSENAGVTAADVDAWVQAGLLEIWNHGALNHSDADTVEKLVDSIVNGLSELRAQIPSAAIDGWVVPGVPADSSDYMGFNRGVEPNRFYNTDAGRLILANHAVSTGSIAGTAHRLLDGVVRQGQGQFIMDSQSFASVKTEIDQAIANKTGLQAFIHPSQVDLAGKMTLADFTAVLDYIKDQELAGNLAIVSPYEMMVADAR